MSSAESAFVKNVDGGLKAWPELEVKESEDETAFRRPLEDVQASTDLDDPSGA